MSHIPPLPFTLNVYNSLNPDVSKFLVETFPSFFDSLFEKYQVIYGFNPSYILKKNFQKQKESEEEQKVSEAPNKITKVPCKMAQDIQETYHKFLAFLHEDISLWQAMVKNEKLELVRKQMDNSPLWIIKSKAILENISSSQVFEAIYNIEVRKKWDHVFDEFKQIKQITQNLDVIYFSIKVPFPFITPRDFLQRRHFIHHFPSYNQTVIQFKSIELEEFPHNPKKIRGETIVSGYLITALEKNKCQLELISMVDIKGDVPKIIYNLVATKAPVSWIENLKNYCLGKEINKNIF